MTTYSALSRLHRAPPLRVTPNEACALWSMDWLRFVCARPPLLEDYPELAIRIRGAFGRKLKAIADAATINDGRLSAYSALFDNGDGGETPKPLVFRCRVQADVVIVDLGFVGHACAWLDECADAMRQALDGGVNLSISGRLRAAFPVASVGWTRETEIPRPSTVNMASLAFQTPVVVRAGGALRTNPLSILRSAPRRCAALAKWQAMKIEMDREGLAEEINALRIDARELIDYRFQRFSQRRGNAAIPVHGYLGKLHVSGAMEYLAPFLAIADRLNLGSHASLGFGATTIALLC